MLPISRHQTPWGSLPAIVTSMDATCDRRSSNALVRSCDGDLNPRTRCPTDPGIRVAATTRARGQHGHHRGPLIQADWDRSIARHHRRCSDSLGLAVRAGDGNVDVRSRPHRGSAMSGAADGTEPTGMTIVVCADTDPKTCGLFYINTADSKPFNCKSRWLRAPATNLSSVRPCPTRTHG
jgi:hypothetical protein